MKKPLILLLIVSFALLSCGKKEVKKVTEESKTAQEAIALAEEIKEAYLKRDLAAMEKNTTKEGYRELLGAIKSFDKAELTFSPKWVEMDKAAVSMKIAWSGKWIVSGETIEERGTALFIFEGSPLKLSRVLRANPFKQPE
ncbi:MAG: hypothetical protein QMD07_05510 [Thermodesulfovibrionales bacterium]|nr:hypothetical protein [Thermodesulfovibrionales bacterium]